MNAMRPRFVTFTVNEEEIFLQLDDDLFYENINRTNLEGYSEIEPITELDIIIQSCINRAIDITIPDGISDTMVYKRNYKS